MILDFLVESACIMFGSSMSEIRMALILKAVYHFARIPDNIEVDNLIKDSELELSSWDAMPPTKIMKTADKMFKLGMPNNNDDETILGFDNEQLRFGSTLARFGSHFQLYWLLEKALIAMEVVE